MDLRGRLPPGDRSLGSKPTPKWVRARVGGATVADSRDARMVVYDFHPHTYAFPRDDVDAESLSLAEEARADDRFGRVRDVSLRLGDRVVDEAGLLLEKPPDEDLAGRVMLWWDRVDAWYEEDDEVFVHPHDPDKRIDVLHSSRHVEVALDGHTLAETRRPTLLFETNLPVRVYLRPTDVDMGALEASDSQTGCAYKGFAEYFHARLPDGRKERNLAWVYRSPFPEAQKVQGMICFFNERVDMTVDREAQQRPGTPWSKPID